MALLSVSIVHYGNVAKNLETLISVEYCSLWNIAHCESIVYCGILLNAGFICSMQTCIPSGIPRRLDDYATPRLDAVTLRPAPSDTVTIHPTNVYILRQSDPTRVGQSDHPQTAQFDPLEVGLNIGCDNPIHEQSDPFSASPSGLGDSSGNNTQMALFKNGAAPPERTSPTHGSAGRKLDLT